MSVKNAIATGMLIFGLVLAVRGYGKKSDEVITEEIQNTEVVVRNSESQHFNWRAFLGFAVAGIGVLLYAFPSQDDFEARRYGVQ
ncbi:MAG: hypothetical protein MRZ79_09955 [Bacteroidia bacterium]|nr:hypothetical protein [Bacteroidia bacterium]